LRGVIGKTGWDGEIWGFGEVFGRVDSLAGLRRLVIGSRDPTGSVGAHARFHGESIFNCPRQATQAVIKACRFNPSSGRIYCGGSRLAG
jgi:hypothetical protein